MTELFSAILIIWTLFTYFMYAVWALVIIYIAAWAIHNYRNSDDSPED